MDRTEKLSIEQKGIDRTEKLSLEQKNYRKNRKAIARTENLSIEQKRNLSYLLCISPSELNFIRNKFILEIRCSMTSRLCTTG